MKTKIQNPVELLYLGLLLRWEKKAPPAGMQGLLDGEPERNTQISRMLYILRKVCAGSVDRTFRKLSVHTRRNDGESYISKNPSWMTAPKEISKGWFLEGCTSLLQKQEILQRMSKLGLSSTFISCADDFVAGASVLQYLPSEKEQMEIVEILER